MHCACSQNSGVNASSAGIKRLKRLSDIGQMILVGWLTVAFPCAICCQATRQGSAEPYNRDARRYGQEISCSAR
jgi:hypothetical protein